MTFRISTDEAMQQYADLVWRIAVLHMGQSPDASDAFQETFLKFHQCDKEFQDESHAKSWLIVVCTNICKDMYRGKHHQHVPLNDQQNAADDRASSILHQVEIADAMARLPQNYRTALYLSAVEGYTASEVASMMDTKENTVYSWISRARKDLKEMLRS